MKNPSYGITVQKLGKVLATYCTHITNYDKCFEIDLKNEQRF